MTDDESFYEEYRAEFGEVRLAGRDARRMVTPYRWLLNKLTGSPLRRKEREALDCLYPNTVTTHRFSKVWPTNVNLRTIQMKYDD